MIPGLATSWKAIDDDDVGVQAAQGRQVPRRQRAHRRGRRVLDRPRRRRSRTARARSSPTRRRSSARRSSIRTRSASSTRRRIRWSPNDLSTIYIVSKKVATGATTEDFNSGKAAIGSGRYKFVRYVQRRPRRARAQRQLLGRQVAVGQGHVQDHQERAGARRGAAVRRRRRDRAAADRRPRAHQGRSQVHGDVEDLAPRHLLQLRPPRPRRARSSPTRTASRSPRIRCWTCACAARSPRRSTGQAIAERVMEGQAIPSGQLVSEKLFGNVPGAQGRRLRSGRREEAAGRSRLSGRLQHHDPRPVGPLRQRREDRAGGRADALAHRHRRQGRDGADGAVLGPRVEAGVQLPHGRLGRVDRRSVESPLRSLLATFNRDKGLGAVNWGRYSNAKVDYLIEQALQQVDDENRTVMLQHATKLAMEDLGIMPIHFQFTIWATKKSVAVHAAHRRVHARVPVQAGGRRSRDRLSVRRRAGAGRRRAAAVPRRR